MPIHLRAEPGDYAEAVLLPGDPLRARHIAETFFDSPRQVNGERGMLGFTGTFEGSPISVQSSGMGCPSAAIVVEELIQLGVKRIVRVGTCGGLQSDMQLGDLILAISAVASDATMLTYTGGEAHSPTADFELVHAAVHQAKHDGTKIRVGPCVSSSTFYDPDTGRAQRWSDRGVLAVEMEAAILFTIAAIRRVQAACLLTVSDVIVEGEFIRITRRRAAGRRRAHDRARHPHRALEGQALTGRAYVIVNPAAQNGAAGRRWPGLAEHARSLGLELDVAFTEAPGHAIELAREAAEQGRELVAALGGDGTVNEVVNGLAASGAAGPELAILPFGTGRDTIRTYGIPKQPKRALELLSGGRTRTIDLGRATFRAASGEGSRWYINIGSCGLTGAVAERAERTSKRLGGTPSFLYATVATFAAWRNVPFRVQIDDPSPRSSWWPTTSSARTGASSAAASRSARRRSPTTACSTCSSGATSASSISRSTSRASTAARTSDTPR